MATENKNLEDSNKTAQVVNVDIVPEMKSSYLDYAMSVIVSRALPDVRDGLKPVHRRILYTMHEMGLVNSSKFRKSAAIIGEVMGKYHPHGDTSIYDAMAKMAQDFGIRYPLVAGQGNFGSLDGDSPAAMRYTEAKMAKISSQILFDIEKKTVEFDQNYDNTRVEPRVLPSMLPTLLLNGTLGIAVGMATKIPPHNLTEVMRALIHLINNDDASTEELLGFIKGPDFPLGGILFGATDIAHAYATGRGGVVVRGEAEIIEKKSGQFEIIITSIPYQINKAEMIIKMAELVKLKKIEGIRDIRDESTKDVRVVVELKNGVYPQKVLNALYKYTPLEETFNFNMVALVDGVPKLLSLRTILQEFIKHREDVVVKRAKFDMEKAEARAHILEGLKKALDHIDKIIALIKKSKDTADAKLNLMKQFKFTELQALAILDMKLQKLAGLERKKIEDELNEKLKLISSLKELLGSKIKQKKLIKEEFEELIEKYGDERRTKVVRGGAKEIKPEDLIPDEESVLVLTNGGYIKRTNPAEYKIQRRGGVGVVDLDTKEEDFISILLTASTHSDLLFFSDKGKAYQIKMYDIPEGKRATRGKSIMNFLPLTDGENITSVLPVAKKANETASSSLLLLTKSGVAKKVKLDSFRDVRSNGIVAIKLSKGDSLYAALLATKDDSVVIATTLGQSIRFKESDIRIMGRTAAGVRAMKLKNGDSVIGAGTIDSKNKEASLFVLSENGYGKMTKIKEYKIQKRGGSGIKTTSITKKTGGLMTGKIVTGEDEVIAMSKNGQVIRISIAEVPRQGRQTQGVRIMKLRAGDALASMICL